MVRLRQLAAVGGLTPNQTKQLLDTMKVLDALTAQEDRISAMVGERKLSDMSDAELRAFALAALGALPTDIPTPSPPHHDKLPAGRIVSPLSTGVDTSSGGALLATSTPPTSTHTPESGPVGGTPTAPGLPVAGGGFGGVNDQSVGKE